MAIAYANSRIISRAKNGSSLRSAAYNWRHRVTGEKIGENYNFSSGRDPVLHHDVLIPDGASRAFKNPDRLWRAAEKAEKRKDAQVAKEVVIALPRNAEIGEADWIALTARFANQQFVSHGLAAQIDIHADPHNPHAHILVTTRRLEGDRLAARKARDLNPPFARSGTKKGFVTESDQIGQAWSELQNRYFREQGIPLRVDPTAAVPGQHIGPVRHRKPDDPKVARDAELRRRNREAAMDPEKVIAALTRTKATFIEREVTTLLRKAGLDKPQVADMKAKVMGHHSLIALYDPKTGDLAERYTTKDIRAQERAVLAEAAVVAQTHHPKIDIPAPKWLRADQRAAHQHMLDSGGLKIIEGRAGVGKSAMLSAAKDAFEARGYRVVGMGPTNTVANDMRERDGIRDSRTAHSWLFRLANGMDAWSHKTALFVDEGAMQSAAITHEVMQRAREAQAKVILVGDDRQLGSIERGAMFTELVAAHGSVEVTEVVRQQQEWQRQVSRDLAAGRFGAAVEALDANGAITWDESRDASLARLVGAWAQDTKADPKQSRFAFAWTNDDVDILNREIREVRKGWGELGPGVGLTTNHGRAEFSVGDRVQFTQTDKKAGIFNGATATITAIRSDHIAAKTSAGAMVSWNPNEFAGFRHGYSGTIYRGQGQTLDATYVLHSGHWRAPASYVALTRQRSDVRLFVSRSVAVDLRELAEQMGKPEQRGASLRWEDNREEAVRKSVEMGKAMQQREQATRLEQAQRPARNGLELLGRKVVAGTVDYLDALDLLTEREVRLAPRDSDNWRRKAENKLDWSIKRAEARDEALSQRSPDDWAKAIKAGTASFGEALEALNGGKKVPLEQWQATSRTLMDAIRKHDGWGQQQAQTIRRAG